MLYEIGNPSDCVTFEAHDDKIAAAVVLLLGSGQYFLNREDDSRVDVPVLLFVRDEKAADEMLNEYFGGDYGAYVSGNKPAIAEALESCLCMSFSSRKTVAMAGEHMSADEFVKYKAKVNEERRSSMNNICGRAYHYAKQLREPPKNGRKRKQAV